MSSSPPDQALSLERAALSRALGRVALQDRDALQEVYRRTSRKLFGICLRILGERSEAEDAMQEVYLTIWRRAGSFDPARGNPISWLAALTRNRAIDLLRRSGRRESAPIELAVDVADESPDAETALIEQGDEARITYCIERLAKSDAAMIRTAFFEGTTYADLAGRSDLPLGTVKSRIRRALLKLRECLG
ncbi:MAG: sigma-70 family RNA polymerase sigma factor [Novosphingobium sp.]|uniref:sigma-70 family RNA polymerase sigma factor n=1 Tax=Novosphingobium sp. TaxID=1874826 RepID=UPI003C7B94B3